MDYFLKEANARKMRFEVRKRRGGTELFPYNQRAYKAVERLLKETGRAAVVHPSGTGESFIAFHQVETHPQA